MKKKKRARIQDVAELAGVSNMTVSRVVNGGVKVSDEKRKAVLDAMKSLYYQPDSAARRLAGTKSYILGLLFQDEDVSYISKFLLRASKSCRNFGHHLIPDGINSSNEESISVVKNLIETTQIDGFILLAPISNNTKVIELLQQLQVPFVRISPDDKSDISPYIAIDEFMAGYTITKYLIELGHSKIAHIQGHPNQAASNLRQQGFLKAMSENSLVIPTEYIVQGYYTYGSGLNAAKDLLTLENKPTAIFAANDEMAAAAVSVAHGLGIKIPKHLSVAGIDDAQLAITISPHLTTIRQPIEEMAELAVQILASNKPVTGDSTELKHSHIFDIELIKRESTIRLE